MFQSCVIMSVSFTNWDIILPLYCTDQHHALLYHDQWLLFVSSFLLSYPFTIFWGSSDKDNDIQCLCMSNDHPLAESFVNLWGCFLLHTAVHLQDLKLGMSTEETWVGPAHLRHQTSELRILCRCFPAERVTWRRKKHMCQLYRTKC